MKITSKQKELFNLELPIMIYVDEFDISAIGYCTKVSGRGYEIHLSKELDKLVRNVVLIHELAHIKLGHADIDLEKARDIIEGLFKEVKSGECYISLTSARQITNIAMDLEVNSKYFTSKNIKVMSDANFPPYIRTDYKPPIEYKENWIEYARELVKLDRRTLPKMRANDINDSSIKSISSELIGRAEDVIIVNKDDEMTIKSIGTSGETGEKKESLKENSKKMIEFLQSILTDKRVTQFDSMKIYNRGTRGRSNVIYTSQSKKVRKDISRLMIVIDVSGSMDNRDISIAIRSCAGLAKQSGIEAKVVYWNTQKCQEYDIQDIPEKVSSGGGTNIFASLDYAKRKGFDKVVLYSDMETPGSLERAKKRLNMWVASIIVDSECLSQNHSDNYKDVTENSDLLLLL